MQKRSIRVIIILTVIALLYCLNNSIRADQVEKILNYHSRLIVHEDGSMTVTETIKVVCRSKSILIDIKTKEFIKCISILENGLIFESITPIT